MQKWNGASRSGDCEGISCIVRAVRAGDDRLIGLLLKRFAQDAEFESPFHLRDALNGGTESALRPATAAGWCENDL